MVDLINPFGTIGLPPAVKQIPRADFQPNEFLKLIEIGGMRVVWQRASACPCVSVNGQTRQPDPTCVLCKKTPGWFYFGPTDYVAPPEAGALDDLQKKLIGEGAVIRAIMTSIQVTQDAYERYGNWIFGSALLTVRAENKLGYYDRIIHLDSLIAHSEVLEVKGETLTPRFLIVQANIVRTTSMRFELGADFEIDAGELRWVSGRKPIDGTRVSIHYLMRPQWIVLEHAKVTRETALLFKKGRPKTPVGDPVALPIQSMARLEFLV